MTIERDEKTRRGNGRETPGEREDKRKGKGRRGDGARAANEQPLRVRAKSKLTYLLARPTISHYLTTTTPITAILTRTGGQPILEAQVKLTLTPVHNNIPYHTDPTHVRKARGAEHGEE